MRDFDATVNDTQEIIDEKNLEKMKEKEEAEKALKIQKEREQEEAQFKKEEQIWEQGILYNDPLKFNEYLEKGHKPTYESCGGAREYYDSLASERYSFYKNPYFEEIFESACAHGLEKSDAEKLLKFAFTPKAISILVDKGGADIQNYPVDKIALLYDEVIGERDVAVGGVHDGMHGRDDVMGRRRDALIADNIENAVHEILKRGYDIKKSPQHAEKLKSLLTKIQKRQQAIAKERMDLEEKRRQQELAEEIQKRNGDFFKVDDKRNVVLYNPDNNNHGLRDKNFNETATNMVEIANKTGLLVETTFNGAHFQIKPGMTVDQADKVYNIALRQLYRDKEDPHFQVDYDVYPADLREKVQDKLYDVEGPYDLTLDEESKAKLAQDKDNNILCYNDSGTLRWIWKPKEDILISHNDKDACPYEDLNYDGLRKQRAPDNKLAKIRNKAAKLADRIAEVTGTEKLVQKVTGGKKIEDVNIGSKTKAIEKKISDRFFGKIKE